MRSVSGTQDRWTGGLGGGASSLLRSSRRRREEGTTARPHCSSRFRHLGCVAGQSALTGVVLMASFFKLQFLFGDGVLVLRGVVSVVGYMD